jgi:arsenite methyltransferase
MPDAGSVFDDQTSRRLEVVYHTPDIVNQRRRTLSRLAPAPGERILDIGCGPGLLVAEMAKAVGPAGHVTGIDIADAMIALSAQRFTDSPLVDRMTFLKADATALPFADETFDAAVSVQVYEYVEDVEIAICELHRVLKPGGRTVILDTDWDSMVWHAADRQRMQRVLEAWVARFAHPTLPRRLSQLLRRAGFAIEHRDVLVLFNPEYDQNSYSVAHLPIMADFAVEHGGMNRSEADAWQQDLANLGNQGLYFFSLNRYEFVAKR